MLQRFTKLNNKKRQARKDEALTLKVFPENVKEFTALHSTCFPPGKEPVECRIDHRLIKDTVSFVAARGTNTLVRSQTSPFSQIMPSPGPMQMGSSMQQQLQSFIGSCVQNIVSQYAPGVSGAPSCGRDVGITFNPVRPPPRRALPVVPHAAVHGDTGALGGLETDPTTAAPAHAPAAHEAGDARAGVDPFAGFMEDEKEEDEVDKLLPPRVKATLEAAAKGVPAPMKAAPKTKGKPSKPPAMKVIKDAKPKAGASKKGGGKKSETLEYTKRPLETTSFPFVYRGCKVYYSPSRESFRVMPRPGISVFDKPFSYKGSKTDKSKAFQAMLAYCEKPVIPKDSANYVK